MPCLEEKDLSALAQHHIQAQKANIVNQRQRLTEIEAELNALKSNPAADSMRLREVENAHRDLEYHLNGRVERSKLEEEAAELQKSGLKPDRLQKIEQTLTASSTSLLKDPDLDVAEERVKVMEALYTQRQHLVFQDTAHDTDKDGNPIPRYASVFGAPTINKMREIGQKEIAEELILRSVSHVMNGESSKNPSDYLDATHIEVKKSLSDGTEHHHIHNNVHVDTNGRVTPASVRYFRNPKTGDIEMEVIPEYWNSAKHGKNTQFIELMDGAHSGDDTATHLHYYKFKDSESATIKEKIKSKVTEINTTNATKSAKLETELIELRERKQDPKTYETKLQGEIALAQSKIASHDADEAKYTTLNKNGVPVKNKGLTPDEEKELQDTREQRKALQKSLDKTQKALTEHQTFITLESDLQQWKSDKVTLESQKNAIKLNARFPDANGYPDKATAKAVRDKLRQDADNLNTKIQTNQKLLRDKGSVDQQIHDKTAKLLEAEKLSKLSEADALALYEKTNGYFSFDKGHQESQDYSKSRPRMNSEIHKYNARQAISVLESSHGADAMKELQRLAENSYKRNLLYNAETIMNKVAGTLS
ncbi:MAG: hypothetical protein KME60_13565 [Cyanomargarita calcarea GSE-NOS-MK-12-04C]|jgi:hypothetical protein|uniref:Uncharacterized protein n=1 Tax=Cyanomargarita calcarea GSE-NOS-MK-12-04C TaxID=2839659 RepID=A0A951QLW8_9CYAN|nr:hypothetical protein [Cyanomargarita calcarea GSE-NOS-MK-12-04C]